MSKNQKTVFWPMILCFYVSVTSSLYSQGAFEDISFLGVFFWLAIYALCTALMLLFVKRNSKLMDKWCGDE